MLLKMGRPLGMMVYLPSFGLSCVGELVTDVFNYSFDTGEMSNSQQQAIITLTVKKEKDRTHLENWRPISLVNADSKFASKVISNRIKKVLPRSNNPLQSIRF